MSIGHRSEKALQGYEKLTFLTRFLPVAVYTTNNEGVIDYYNDAAAGLWGRKPKLNDPDEKRFCGSWKIYDSKGNHIPHEKCALAKTLHDAKPRKNEEVIIMREDKSRSNVLAQIDPLYDSEGALVGAINVMFEVTDRKRIEKDVYHLAAIVESSDDAIVSKTLDGDITSWNKGAERIFGFSAEEAIGKNITMFIPDDRIDEEAHIIAQIRGGNKVDHFETIRKTKSGRLINVSLTISPIFNAQGEIIGASKIARDIDEQVEIKRKLNRYNVELKRLNNYKDEFISLASHELKTPITVIKAHLELLQEIAPGDYKSYLDKTLLHVDKLIHLIDEMLDISKIEEQKMKLDRSEFGINELLDGCVETVNMIYPGANVIFKKAEPDIAMYSDKQRLEQVITNLINNAIKYSSVEKEVVLEATRVDEDTAEINISDKGIGIPQEEQEKIFRRFYRMSGISKNVAGLGIGLYISRQIIEKHRGKIWVSRSEKGKGSTFTIQIPVK